MNGWSTSSITEQISNLLQYDLGGVYSDPPRITRDSTNLLTSPIGCNLRPSTSSLYENDGQFTPAALLFSGTVAMVYRGNTYNIPVDIYLPPRYPVAPPVCFVRPVTGMEIKSKHKNVGADGMVYAPYLSSWSPHACSLVALVRVMSNIFSVSPPVFSKPVAPTATNGCGGASAAARPTPTTTQTYDPDAERRLIEQEIREANEAAAAARRAEEEERRLKEEERKRKEEEERLRIEREIAEANAAAEAARRAEEEEKRLEEERKRQEEERRRKEEEEERLRIEREIAEANAAAEAARRAEEEEKRLEEERKRQEEEEKRIRIEREIAEANAAAEAARRAEEEERQREEERRRLEEEERQRTIRARSELTLKLQQHLRVNNETCRSIISTDLKDQKRLVLGSSQLVSQLSELEAVREQLSSGHQKMDDATLTLESNIAAIEAIGAPSVDDLAIPFDIHSDQMLQLSAENASIGDCLYFLDRALAKGNLTLDVHLKRVRRLAKRQFMVRAHLLKIGQAKAASRKHVI